MQRIIAIANQKGGVGKTTTAINLGASLAVADRRVLLIDSDPQGNATSGLGFRPKTLERTILDFLLDGLALSEVMLDTMLPGLMLVPANQTLVQAEKELLAIDRRASVLRTLLTPLAASFDFVLIDCPPSLGLLTANALTAADSLLIPLQAEYYALEGLSALFDTIRLIRKTSNPGLEILGILLTMFDPRNRLSFEVADDVRQKYPDKVFKQIIPRNVRLAESPSHGLPIVKYDIRSSGAEAYLSLAREILGGGS